MKQKVTHEFDLSGFRDYCEKNGFYRFIIASENQNNYFDNFCVGYTITFYHIDIIPDSYRLFIYNNNTDDVMYRQCYISFELVKHVTVEEIDKSGFFCEVTLFCGKSMSSSNVKKYKLIAQKRV